MSIGIHCIMCHLVYIVVMCQLVYIVLCVIWYTLHMKIGYRVYMLIYVVKIWCVLICVCSKDIDIVCIHIHTYTYTHSHTYTHTYTNTHQYTYGIHKHAHTPYTPTHPPTYYLTVSISGKAMRSSRHLCWIVFASRKMSPKLYSSA